MGETSSSVMNGSVLNENITCGSEFLIQYATFSLIGQVGLIAFVSVFITAATCFMQKRKRFQRCCFGFPGLSSPMDFLVTPRYRWIYIALFFVMTASLINTYSAMNSFSIENIYLYVFYSTIILPVTVITIMSIQFFPLFACVDAAPFPMSAIARSFGLFYSIIWLSGIMAYEASTYLQYVYCTEDGLIVIPVAYVIVSAICEDVPLFLAGGFIVSWYLYRLIEDMVKLCLQYRQVDIDQVEWLNKIKIRLKIKKRSKRDAQLLGVRSYHIEHVKRMLVKPPPPKEYGKVASVFIKIIQHFFPYNRYDRLPLPYLGSVAAIVMLLYQFTLRLLSWGLFLVYSISLTYTQQIQPALQLSGSTDAVLRTVVVGFPIVVTISPVVSSLLVFILLVHMTGAVSQDIKRVSKYGFSEKVPSTLSIVPGMWKYIGIQIGYALSAWTIYAVVAIVAGLSLALIIVCLQVFTSYVLSIALVLLITFGFPKLIYYCQYLICRFVFFEDRQGKFISITNRRLFNWFAFVLFFYNGIAGVFGALLRALLSSVFGLLLLFRLDRIVLMKGFEGYDFGHKKYVGFLYLYTAYNNAVVHVFTNLLKNTLATNTTTKTAIAAPETANIEEMKTSNSDVELVQVEQKQRDIHPPSCRRVCNRWLLAYTLLRNPSLATMRHHRDSLTDTNKQPENATSSTTATSHDSSRSPRSSCQQDSNSPLSQNDAAVMVLHSSANNRVVAEPKDSDVSVIQNTATITFDNCETEHHSGTSDHRENQEGCNTLDAHNSRQAGGECSRVDDKQSTDDESALSKTETTPSEQLKIKDHCRTEIAVSFEPDITNIENEPNSESVVNILPPNVVPDSDYTS